MPLVPCFSSLISRSAATASAVVSATMLLTSVGCTTRSQVFDGYGDDQLWTAMVATARSPEYDDWKVSDNQVFVDDASRRIEIYRVLKRTYVTPWSDPLREDLEWRFQVVLSRDSADDAPLVDFTARQIAVPAHVWSEADRYFAQMRSYLGPIKASEQPVIVNDGVPVPPPLDEPSASTAASPVQPAPPSEPAAEPLPE
jgi:hypothetical protein